MDVIDSNDSCGDARREKCFEAGAPDMISRRGRRSKYTAEEDPTILREVAAMKAHISQYGKDSRAVPNRSRKG